jgi:hypothetical protein
LGGAEQSVPAGWLGRFVVFGAFRGVATLLVSGSCYLNNLEAVLVYAVNQLRSSSVKGSVDFRVA